MAGVRFRAAHVPLDGLERIATLLIPVLETLALETESAQLTLMRLQEPQRMFVSVTLDSEASTLMIVPAWEVDLDLVDHWEPSSAIKVQFIT